MRFKSITNLGLLGTAVGFAAFVLAFQLQVSAMPSAILSVNGINPASIDRTFKGDRLPVVPAVVRPPQRSEQPRLPDGCVEASNWHKDKIYSAEIAGRCIG